MPLDALYEGDRRLAQDSLMAALTNAQNQYQTGLAQSAEQGMLANRGLDSDMAARGLFGSGVERRGERLIGNQLAQSNLGLLSNFTGAQSGANMDYSRQLQEALLQLALRQQQNENIPLPGKPNPPGRPKPKKKPKPKPKRRPGIRR